MVTREPESGDAAFFVPEGDSFLSTEHTRGPWDSDSQHAGPPAALIGRAIERLDGLGGSVSGRHVGRITFEILQPVPIAPLRIEAEVVRPGRRVDMAEATLLDEAGTPLVRARAWRLLRRAVEVPDGLASEDEGTPAVRAGRPGGGTGPPVPPSELDPGVDFFPTGHDVGYHTAMEYRFARGAFSELGAATAWMRTRIPLVRGEEPTPLQRVLLAADSGNGISATLDFRSYVFINVDLTVHLGRMPKGEWVCLDSLTIPEPTGVGLTDTMLLDELGPIGRAAQTLMVAER